LRLQIQDFTCLIKNMGLYEEFTIWTQGKQHPNAIDEDEWTMNHPLCWKT
jgi:hypothetical protein